MAAKKVGTLIREARTEAGLTQAQLAGKIDGVSASDISKAERGEKDLTQAQLKQAAKALGITQVSLLDAPKNTASKTSSSKKTASSAKTTSMKLTASEKKLVEYYRNASSDAKKAAVNLLKGTDSSTSASDIMSMLGSLIGAAGTTGSSSGKKKEGLSSLISLFSDDKDFDFNEIFNLKK